MNRNLKAGFWYTAANFINKGIVFLITPIFTRLMTKAEFGDFNNFVSWATLLVIITSLTLSASINRAYFDYKEDFSEYLSTMSMITIVSTLIFYLVVFSFRHTFMSLFQMDMRYVNILFLYLLFFPAYDFFMYEQRISGNYKTFAILSLSVSALSTLVSVLLVCFMPDRLLGRTLGYVLPMVTLNVLLYGYFLFKGRKVIWGKAKYGLLISIPLIPHLLSNNVLNSADRIMINKYSGAEATALYSLGYMCALVVTLLHQSINNAFVPWFYHRLNDNKLDGISKSVDYLFAGFLGLTLGFVLVAPEAIFILGGEKYAAAIYLIPMVMLGCCFQCLYTFYVNIEFYNKKTITISIGTIIAAVVNIGLNFLLIPRYGYLAAAFNTLIGYVVLYVVHFIATRRMEFRDVYHHGRLLFYILVFSGVCALSYWLYRWPWIRRGVLCVYILVFLILVIKNWGKIKARGR